MGRVMNEFDLSLIERFRRGRRLSRLLSYATYSELLFRAHSTHARDTRLTVLYCKLKIDVLKMCLSVRVRAATPRSNSYLPPRCQVPGARGRGGGTQWAVEGKREKKKNRGMNRWEI